MEEKVQILNSLFGEIKLTMQKLKHPKSGKVVDYFIISDGLNSTGVYIDKNTAEGIIRFLGGKSVARK